MLGGRQYFMGVCYDNLSRAQTILDIQQSIDLGFSGFLRSDINVSLICMADVNEDVREAILSANVVNIDGVGALIGAKFLGMPVPEKISGVDLFCDLLVLANEKSYRVFFLGATDDVIRRVCEKVNCLYPNIEICGFENGYISGREDFVLEKINSVKPDMIFLGMPSPMKETFALRIRKINGARFIMGVGGTFDVFSGVIKRAPKWMQTYGLEWFFRFIQEPKRMWRRYLETNSKFAILLICQKIKRYMK